MPGIGITGGRFSSGGGGSTPTLSVAVSDANPNVGDTITLTATPSGFTPTEYYFFAKKGIVLINIGTSITGIINWVVSTDGSIEIYAQADDGAGSAFNIGGEPITSSPTIILAGLELYFDPFISNIVAPTYPDISGNSRDGTIVNSPTIYVGSLAPNDGGYLELNGIDQYVNDIGTVADFSFVQNTCVFTMMGFVKITDLTKDNILLSTAAASAEKGFLFNACGTNPSGPRTRRIFIAINKGTSGNLYTIRSNDNVINDNDWHHVAITCNGYGTGQIYLDGVAITTIETLPSPAVYPTGNSTNILTYGTSVFSASLISPLSGRVGPVQIYDVELTALEVQYNFNFDKARYGL